MAGKACAASRLMPGMDIILWCYSVRALSVQQKKIGAHHAPARVLVVSWRFSSLLVYWCVIVRGEFAGTASSQHRHPNRAGRIGIALANTHVHLVAEADL
jgi:hypothetical protein